MNKFTMLASVVAVALSASAFAHDYEAAPVSSDFYATAGAGYGRLNLKNEKNKAHMNSYSGMIGFGKQIDSNVRTDLTLDYSKKNEYSVYSVMANVYYHFNGNSNVSPYATVGLGYANQKFDIVKKGGIAFQVGAGVSAKISDKVVLDLGYRFFKPKNIKINDSKIKFNTHKIMAAIRLPL